MGKKQLIKPENSYSRMIALLKTTGLYRLDGSTIVERKIRVWANIIQQLELEIESLPENTFPSTMNRDGFDNYRRLYALPLDLDWDELVKIVELRRGLSCKDFTKAGVMRCMAAGGFQVELVEDFARGQLTVRVLQDAGAFGSRAEKEAFLQACLPVHAHGEIVWAA